MNIKEILAEVGKKDLSILDGISEEKTIRLIRLVFGRIAHLIDSKDEGVIKIGGLGRFSVRTIEREKEGGAVLKKRIVFYSLGSERKKDAKISEPK